MFHNTLCGVNKYSGNSVSLGGHCKWKTFNVNRLDGELQTSMLVNISLCLSLSPEKNTASSLPWGYKPTQANALEAEMTTGCLCGSLLLMYRVWLHLSPLMSSPMLPSCILEAPVHSLSDLMFQLFKHLLSPRWTQAGWVFNRSFLFGHPSRARSGVLTASFLCSCAV